MIISSGMGLLLDGSLDIRTEAKTIFVPFVSHPRFEEVVLRGIIEKKCKEENSMDNFNG